MSDNTSLTINTGMNNHLGNIPTDQSDATGIDLADRLGHTYGTPAERGRIMARMTSTAQPAPHETLALHELLLRNAATAQRLEGIVDAISDPKLRALTSRCIDACRGRIQKTDAALQHHEVLQ